MGRLFFSGRDMSSLLAISVNLEALKASAKGYAVIRMTHETGKQLLQYLAGIQLIWVIYSATTKHSFGVNRKKYAETNGSKQFLIHVSQADSRECAT